MSRYLHSYKGSLQPPLIIRDALNFRDQLKSLALFPVSFLLSHQTFAHAGVLITLCCHCPSSTSSQPAQIKAEGLSQVSGGPCTPAVSQAGRQGVSPPAHTGQGTEGVHPTSSAGNTHTEVRTPVPREVADGAYIHTWIMQGNVRGGSPLAVLISFTAVFFKLWGSWIR